MPVQEHLVALSHLATLMPPGTTAASGGILLDAPLVAGARALAGVAASTSSRNDAAHGEGLRREELDVPFVDEAAVTGTSVLLDPLEPDVRWFVPAYRLDTSGPAGDERLPIALRRGEEGWSLTIALLRSRPDGVPADTREVAHEARLDLLYDAPLEDGGSMQQWEAFELRPTAEGAVATLVMRTLAHRDAVFHGLTRREARPHLRLACSVRVAVRRDPPPPPVRVDVLALSPSAAWAGARLTDASGNSVEDAWLPFNGSDGDDRGFVILSDAFMEDSTVRRALRMHPKWVPHGTIKGWHPMVPLPAGAVLEADVGFVAGAVNTDGVEFIVFEHHDEPWGRVWNIVLRHHKAYTGALDHVVVDLSHLAGRDVGLELRVDAGASSAQDWAAWVDPVIVGTSGAPPEPRYSVAQQELPSVDLLPVPFLDPDLHSYAFAGLGGVGGEVQALRTHTVVHDGTPHRYVEQPTRPGLFAYLPDAFRLSRRRSVPHAPELSVQFTSTDARVESLTARVTFALRPVVSTARLTAAAEQLRRNVPLLPADQPVAFECLRSRPEHLRLRLALPGPGAGVQRVELPTAVAALDREISDEISMDVVSFQAVLDVLLGVRGSPLFTGTVFVEIPGVDVVDIPVELRLADPGGESLTAVEEPTAAGVRVTLRNDFESPVRVPQLRSRFSGEGAEQPAVVHDLRLDGAEVPVPVVLAPGASLTFLAAREDGTPPGPVDVVHDLGDLEVQPDREQVLTSVVDQSVTTPLRQRLDVTLFPDVFAAVPELRRVVVEFSTGAVVEFSRADFGPAGEHVTRSVELPLPLLDVLVRRQVGSGYRYRVRGIGPLGDLGAAAWTDGSGPLFPDVRSLVG